MVPNLFGTRGQFHEDNFFMDWDGGDAFKMTQAHCIYCVLYICYYYISSTSGHQTLDPSVWCVCVCVCVCVCTRKRLFTQLCPTLGDPMDSSPSGFFVYGDSPGKDTCPPPGDLPNLGIESRSPALQADSLSSEPSGKPLYKWTQPLVGISTQAPLWGQVWPAEMQVLLAPVSVACSSTKLHVPSLFQSDVHAEAPQILASCWCKTQRSHPGSDPQCWGAGCPPGALFYPLGEAVGSGRSSVVLTWGRDKWSDCDHSSHPSMQSFPISVNQWSTWASVLSSGIFVKMLSVSSCLLVFCERLCFKIFEFYRDS